MSKFRANIFLIQTTSNYLWASEVGAVKVDYFDLHVKKMKNKCELDVVYAVRVLISRRNSQKDMTSHCVVVMQGLLKRSAMLNGPF